MELKAIMNAFLNVGRLSLVNIETAKLKICVEGRNLSQNMEKNSTVDNRKSRTPYKTHCV
jgi:hypothetical protein